LVEGYVRDDVASQFSLDDGTNLAPFDIGFAEWKSIETLALKKPDI